MFLASVSDVLSCSNSNYSSRSASTCTAVRREPSQRTRPRTDTRISYLVRLPLVVCDVI